MKTIYVSDNGNQYSTEKACIEADKKFAEAKAKQEKEYLAKKAEKEKLDRERKDRAEEVQNAYQSYLDTVKELNDKANKAFAEYSKKLKAFTKDYGAYHTKVISVMESPYSLLDNVLSSLDIF